MKKTVGHEFFYFIFFFKQNRDFGKSSKWRKILPKVVQLVVLYIAWATERDARSQWKEMCLRFCSFILWWFLSSDFRQAASVRRQKIKWHGIPPKIFSRNQHKSLAWARTFLSCLPLNGMAMVWGGWMVKTESTESAHQKYIRIYVYCVRLCVCIPNIHR